MSKHRACKNCGEWYDPADCEKKRIKGGWLITCPSCQHQAKVRSRNQSAESDASDHDGLPVPKNVLVGGAIGGTVLLVLVAAFFIFSGGGDNPAGDAIPDNSAKAPPPKEVGAPPKRVEAEGRSFAVVDFPVPPLKEKKSRVVKKAAAPPKQEQAAPEVFKASPDPPTADVDVHPDLQLASEVADSSSVAFASRNGPFYITYQPLIRERAFDIEVEGGKSPEVAAAPTKSADNPKKKAAPTKSKKPRVEGLPEVSIKVVDDTTSEAGGDSAIVQLVRTGKLEKTLLVKYRVSGSAKLFEDYTGPTGYRSTGDFGTIGFPPNRTSNIVIRARGDDEPEQPETAVITLLEGEGYNLGKQIEARITIVDASSAGRASSAGKSRQFREPRTPSANNQKKKDAKETRELRALAVTVKGADGADVKMQPKQILPPITVTDMRNGRSVGTFHYLAPVWREGVLSPNGRIIVGPDSYPRYVTNPGPNSAHHNGMDRTEREGLVFVWEQRKDEPARALQFENAVGWLDFVDPTELAVLTYAPEPQLQIWDVASAETKSKIALDPQSFPLSDLRGKDEPKKLVYAARAERGAVSPGGRYVALGGGRGIELIDLKAGETVATFPLDAPPVRRTTNKTYSTPPRIEFDKIPHRPASTYCGLNFGSDGTTLYAVVEYQVPNGGAGRKLYGWHMEDGRKMFETTIKSNFPFEGQPLRGSRPKTVILPRYLNKGVPMPGGVVHTDTGAVVEWFGFFPVRWVDGAHLLATGKEYFAPHSPMSAEERAALTKRVDPHPASRGFGPEMLEYAKNQKDYVFTTTYDVSKETLTKYPYVMSETEEVELDPSIMAAGGARPAAQAGDLSGIAAQTPQPPDQWKAPPVADFKATDVELESLPDGLFAQSPPQTTVASVAEYEPKNGYDLKNGGVVWRRFDLSTGTEVGQPIELWPWLYTMKRKEPATNRYTVAATADGELFAMQDPGYAERLDLWSGEGKRLYGLIPDPDRRAIEWLGFAGEETLLVLTGGRLTAWDAQTGKAKFQVVGGYAPPLHVSPDGAWVAARAGYSHFDVLDAKTGKCLGRRNAPEGKQWWGLLLAPDGSKIVALRSGTPFTGRMQGMFRAAADVFDAATGELDRTAEFYELSSRSRLDDAVWADSGRIVAKINVFLFAVDLQFTMATARVALKGNHEPIHHDVRQLAGVLWKKAGGGGSGQSRRRGSSIRHLLPSGKWDAVRFPNPFREELARNPKLIPFGPGSEVKVEFNLLDSAHSKAGAQRFAALLQERGHVIGPNGWTLRATATMRDSGAVLTGPGRRINVPRADVEWKLIDPAGETAWETTQKANFGYSFSRYTTKSKSRFMGSHLQTETHFDFGANDPRKAMESEILEHFGTTRRLPDPFPYALMPVGNKDVTLPIEVEFEPLLK